MKRIVSTLVLIAVVFAGSACGEEGAMEKAGREVDEAVDDAKEKLKKQSE